MPRKVLRKFLPDSATVRSHRRAARFGSLLHHPNLWHLNRHSIAGGFAVGLFAGLVPGPFQMLCAAILAVAWHVNLPTALLTTLYTNPFTIVPLYVIAYRYGRLLLGGHAAAPAIQPYSIDWSDPAGSLHALLDWTLALGKPLAVGLPALAVTLAVLGYVAMQAGWRAYVVLAWRARARRRARKAAP